MESTTPSSDDFPFLIDNFGFLFDVVPKKSQQTFRSVPLTITCFDVNRRVFIFGSSIGVVYGFKRGQRISDGVSFKKKIVDTPIVNLKLITDDLLAVASENALHIINWTSNRFLYGWKCDHHLKITSVQSLIDTDNEKIILVSGDSKGTVCLHDIINGTQTILWKEDGHQIVQLEFISPKELLISSCYRTFILIIDQLDHPVQIGSNQRKACGKFGAVYLNNSNLVFAARPSLHLIKADCKSGLVNETIVLKKAAEPEKQAVFDELRLTSSNATKLGFLLPFCDEDLLISWNESSFFITDLSGKFYLKESNLLNLLDVKITNGNDKEVFLLFYSRNLFRIKLKSQQANMDVSTVMTSSIKVNEDDSNSSHSTESLFNKFGPLNFNAISVEEEIKKVFKKIQNNFSQNLNKLSTSIISVIDTNNINIENEDKATISTDANEQEITNQIEEQSEAPEDKDFDLENPIVIRKKPKKVVKKESNEDISDELVIQKRKKSLSKVLQDINKDPENTKRNAIVLPTNFDALKDCSIDNNEEKDELCYQDKDDQLLNILKAYKEAKGFATETFEEELELESEEKDNAETLKVVEDNFRIYTPLEVCFNDENDDEKENELDSAHECEAVSRSLTTSKELSIPKGTLWQENSDDSDWVIV